MFIHILYIIIGFIILVWAADQFVEGTVSIAEHFGMPKLLIALTLVALGTSAPEVIVSINAVLQGTTDIAIGNAIGSNIANIGLILGIVVLVQPLSVQSRLLRREYPILFLMMLFAWMLMIDGDLDRLDGLLLLLSCLLVMLLLAWLAVRERPKTCPVIDSAVIPKFTLGKAWGWFIVGLVFLLISAKIIVVGAVALAQSLGVSELIIGLTIVAMGTSLPEIAASITSATKGQHDIAIGTIIGSNIFNLVVVLPFAGLLAPAAIDNLILQRDMPVMFIITILLFIVAYGFRGPGHITRWEGAGLLGAYIAYLVWLACAA